jgi:hypothetical protein
LIALIIIGKYFHFNIYNTYNHIDDVMVRVLAASVVDRGVNQCRANPKTTMLLFTASQPSTQEIGKLVGSEYGEWSDMSTCRVLF